MLRNILAVTLPFLFFVNAAWADSDPILERQKLMEDTRDAAPVIGGMMKGAEPFDAEAAMAAFKVWKNTAETAGGLFPDGSGVGHETEAKVTIWTDRAGFEAQIADFGAAVDAAIAGKPDDLEALKAVAGPVFQSCKGCHEGYRGEKEN